MTFLTPLTLWVLKLLIKGKSMSTLYFEKHEVTDAQAQTKVSSRSGPGAQLWTLLTEINSKHKSIQMLVFKERGKPENPEKNLSE